MKKLALFLSVLLMMASTVNCGGSTQNNPPPTNTITVSMNSAQGGIANNAKDTSAQ